MTLPTLSPGPVEASIRERADTGGAVPEGFTLPWNTTVTMADVWATKIAVRRQAWREQSYRRRAKHESHSVKVTYAGYDRTEHDHR